MFICRYHRLWNADYLLDWLEGINLRVRPQRLLPYLFVHLLPMGEQTPRQTLWPPGRNDRGRGDGR